MEPEAGVAKKGRRHPGAETSEEMLVRLVGEQTRVIAALRAEIDALRAQLKAKDAA